MARQDGSSETDASSSSSLGQARRARQRAARGANLGKQQALAIRVQQLEAENALLRAVLACRPAEQQGGNAESRLVASSKAPSIGDAPTAQVTEVFEISLPDGNATMKVASAGEDPNAFPGRQADAEQTDLDSSALVEPMVSPALNTIIDLAAGDIFDDFCKISACERQDMLIAVTNPASPEKLTLLSC